MQKGSLTTRVKEKSYSAILFFNLWAAIVISKLLKKLKQTISILAAQLIFNATFMKWFRLHHWRHHHLTAFTFKSHSSISQYFQFDFTAPLENKTYSEMLSKQNNIYEEHDLFKWKFFNNSLEYICHAQQSFQLPPLTVLWLMLQSHLKAHKQDTFWMKVSWKMYLRGPFKTYYKYQFKFSWKEQTRTGIKKKTTKHIAWMSGAQYQQSCSTGLLILHYLVTQNSI